MSLKAKKIFLFLNFRLQVNVLPCKNKSFDQPHIFYRKLDTDKTYLKKNGFHSFKSKTIINVKFLKTK